MNAQLKKDIFTIPNVLSFVRLLLVPLFVVLFFSDAPTGNLRAGAVLLLSGLTDVVDGLIARRFNMTSQFGKFIDPCADKLTQATVCFCLAIRHHEFIVLFAVYFVKELMMLIGGILIMRSGKKIASSRWWGKAATCIVFAVIFFSILFDNLASQAYIAFSVVGIVAVVFSLVLYIPEYFKIKNADGGK